MKVAEGALSWIIFTLFLAGVSFALGIVFIENDFGFIFLFISFILFCLTCLFLIFFRDPTRSIGKEIVACADGKIREITHYMDEDVGDCTKISTFMNLHNVHVNRAPADGVVKSIIHLEGAHLPAFRKDSGKNERVITIIDSEIGKIKIIQIAGTLARRIVPYIKKEDKLKKGDKIGIIRLGSRVDVYLPIERTQVVVKVGDRLKAGVDTIAKIND